LALGLSACAMGLAALLARRRGARRRPWLRPLALAALLGLGGAAAGLAGLPPYLWGPAALLAGAWLVFAFCRSGWAAALGRFAAAGLSRPRAQAAALLVGGCSLLGWQACVLDQRLERELRETDDHVARAAVQALPPLEEVPGLTAWTDAGERVALWRVPAGAAAGPPEEYSYIRENGLRLRLIRTGPASLDCNCHGWVFTGGKFWVHGASVEPILRGNRYRAVAAPAVGDLAVFRDSSGAPGHTALVRAVGEDGAVLLESKWSVHGRFLHTPAGHAYSDYACAYHRSPRGGHLLRVAAR
jgi:hypothetical protein